MGEGRFASAVNSRRLLKVTCDIATKPESVDRGSAFHLRLSLFLPLATRHGYLEPFTRTEV